MGKYLNTIIGLLFFYTYAINSQTPPKTAEGDFNGDENKEIASVVKDPEPERTGYILNVTGLPSITSLAKCDSIFVVKGSPDYIVYIYNIKDYIKNEGGAFEFKFDPIKEQWNRGPYKSK